MADPALEVPVLAGRVVRLEPLAHHHGAGLLLAADEDRRHYGWTSVPADREACDEYVVAMQREQARGIGVGFAQVRQADDRIVGTTRYLTLRRRPNDVLPYAVEIGGTWLAATAQRTAVNTEAKLLLLTFAFETWGVGRVDFKTDERNERSRAAIGRLGASFEGVLRQWQPSWANGEGGLLRNSAMYSIVADEWTAVKAGLEGRLTS